MTLELRQLVLRSSRPRAHQRCILFIAGLDLLSRLISLSWPLPQLRWDTRLSTPLPPRRLAEDPVDKQEAAGEREAVGPGMIISLLRKLKVIT